MGHLHVSAVMGKRPGTSYLVDELSLLSGRHLLVGLPGHAVPPGLSHPRHGIQLPCRKPVPKALTLEILGRQTYSRASQRQLRPHEALSSTRGLDTASGQGIFYYYPFQG